MPDLHSAMCLTVIEGFEYVPVELSALFSWRDDFYLGVINPLQSSLLLLYSRVAYETQTDLSQVI